MEESQYNLQPQTQDDEEIDSYSRDDDYQLNFLEYLLI
jgi:hypothetical protein